MSKRTRYYISLSIFLIFVLAVPLVVFMLPKGKAVYYLAVSLNMLKEGDTEGAVKQAQKAVELRPDSPVTLRGLARAYIEAGRYDAIAPIEDRIALFLSGKPFVRQ